MSILSASGIGSGLDVASIVKQLVAADRAPHAAQINRGQARANARLSAFSQLSSVFDALNKSLSTLKGTGAAFGSRSVTSSAESVLTASAAAHVPAGSYQVEVHQLASAQKWVSIALPADGHLGDFQAKVEFADKTFIVNSGVGGAGNETPIHTNPATFRDNFNAAAEAAGARVRASLVSSDGGVHLVYTSLDTGAANVINVTRHGLGPIPVVATAAMTQQEPAADAQISVDGLLTSAATNQITTAIDGLTIDLKAADPGNVHTLTVTADHAPARKAIESMVNAYNAAVTTMASLTRYDPATDTPASLTGDSLVRGAIGQLRRTLSEGLGLAAGAGLTAMDMGFNTRVDGTIVFDAAKFDAAMAGNEEAMRDALSGANGLGGKLASTLERYIGSDGAFDNRKTSLNEQLKSLSRQRESLDRRMLSVEERYRAQFTALDALVAQLSSTGQYLSQQLANLPRFSQQ